MFIMLLDSVFICKRVHNIVFLFAICYILVAEASFMDNNDHTADHLDAIDHMVTFPSTDNLPDSQLY